MILSPINLAIFSIVLLFVPVLLCALIRQNPLVLRVMAFSLAAFASFLSFIAGLWTLSSGVTNQLILPIGLPALPFHLRLDPLAGFFLMVVGLLAFFVSIYSIGYVQGLGTKRPISRLIVFYNLFIVGMLCVILADDALSFLIAWEFMAGASYFLVLFEDEHVENRRAAFLYLVIAHIGAMAILLAFGVMAGVATGFGNFDGYTFDSMRQATFSPQWATVAFVLAFFGFAAKAGVIPLHVWLPEAHPVAPSNVSALMSGVMLKTAIYGIVRVTFDLLGSFPWWWGALVLVLGLISAVMGVLYALMQHDLKKLLAYHSVENIGIILIGIGLAMIFTSFKFTTMAALALIAGLYHTLNHAMFKGLLFMGAGAVVHATHERNMDEMGGLIHHMPWTAVFFLVGCISISALPPFNGFVSEWLTFQAFLLSPSLPAPLMKLIIPLGAALLALTGALAAACFVKVFGVTFLGHWRGHNRPHIYETCWPMRIGMMLAAMSCLLLGIVPTFLVNLLDGIAETMVGSKLNVAASGTYNWMWLTPMQPERASYSGFIVLIGIIITISIAYLLFHLKSGKIQRGDIWDCGFEKLNHNMQYNAISFSMPIRRIFGFYFNIRERVRLMPQLTSPAFPLKLYYNLRVRDRFWGWIYKPIIEAAFGISRQMGKLQQGQIHLYLIYSFVTIIVLLAVVL
ncbi:MAG: hydrogenase 4 subunit B [Candidatus Magnetoovum sp. WYHC-5]|nr:hydrogenase 4 subunit B [Candidatus Magnetoovum sp. WYHC-5]